MKHPAPLHINTADKLGGAARAANRLHLGLLALGVESRYLSYSRARHMPNSLSALEISGRVPRMLIRLNNRRAVRELARTQGQRRGHFSSNLNASPLVAQINRLRPEVAHLHWIGHDFLPIHDLPRLNVPLVWTLHDSWAFTGGCHVPQECTRYQQQCGRCPVLNSEREADLSRKVWQAKARHWAGLRPVIVTPSRWLHDCARSSALFHDWRIEVIPYGLDLEAYRPLNKTMARTVLNLPTDRQYVAFGAISSTGDRNKGFHFLQPALQKLAHETPDLPLELLVFGAERPADGGPDFGLPVRYLGVIDHELVVNLVYAAADVFVAPSMMENLPNTVLEALASGTPCAAFDIGGMPDMIEHQRNGYLARPFETDDLAHGIRWLLEHSEYAALADRARQKIVEGFALEQIARRYLTLYEEVLGRS